MCDCYYHKCEKCDTWLGVHITDFCLRRDEIKIYCNDHIPKDNVVIFESLGGVETPIDTPENRKIFEEIKRLQVQSIRCDDPEVVLKIFEKRRELDQRLEKKLLPPEESHMALPGYWLDGFWSSVVEDLKEFPKGYKIGVQFLKEPPDGYGLDGSVTPNFGVDYEVRIIGNPVLGSGVVCIDEAIET